MAGVSESPMDAPVYLWVNPRFATPDELGENEEAERLLANAKRFGAHNAPFEIAVTWGAHQRGSASPFRQPPPLEAWFCTAAMARKAALPYSLDKLGEALNLPIKKDKAGAALIKFFCVPTKEGTFNEPKDHPEKWAQFCSYCRIDVSAEKGADHKLKPFRLQGEPLDTFQFDLRMNQRGIPVNVPALLNAQKIITQVQAEVTAEFQKLTGLNPTQREAVRLWVTEEGWPMENMQSETVELAIQGVRQRMEDLGTGGLTDEAQWFEKPLRGLELYQKLSYAAVKKVNTMLDWACPDARLRGVLLYYGTGPGRWSAGGPQVQNAKKATPEMRPLTPEAYAAIERGITGDGLSVIYGEPFEVIASCIRHFIQAPEWMMDGDYNAIQARGICWLAGQHDALNDYRNGVDRYKLMAGEIYSKSEAKVTADEREVGKRAILGCGFSMGPAKFQSSCLEQYGLDLPFELCEKAVKAFRRTHDEVVRYWWRLDKQCRAAINHPGEKQGEFIVRQLAGMRYLLAQLPSGRSLAYPDPKIEKREATPAERKRFTEEGWSDERIMQFLSEITYWGQLPMTVVWGRVKLYGGKLAENITMGVEADIMAHGAIQAEKSGFGVFALIHDQCLATTTADRTPEEYSAALATVPAWAKTMPVRVESRRCKMYSK